jgi:Tol biopolymer transport system component/DNA-binding winged helix-turn-helix (wHTH) protein
MPGESSEYRAPVRFADFEVDFAAATLYKHGTRVKLQEQPFRILEALLARPGEVLSRDELVRMLWAEGTFVDYDHGLNAAVAKLRQALSDSPEQPQYIETLGRRGYRFIGRIEVPPAFDAVAPKRRPAAWWGVSGALIVTTALGLVYVSHGTRTTQAAMVVPLTSYTGAQGCAAFSPDGSQVAFSWRPEGEDNWNIYVRLVGGGPVTRLTREPKEGRLLAWSPDGSQIAFNRGGSVFLISPLGGTARKLTKGRIGASSAWSPDGKWLAILHRASDRESWAVYLVSAATGEGRRITAPPAGGEDGLAAFSPDGRTLAFVRTQTTVTNSLYVLPVRDGMAAGAAQRLSNEEWNVYGLTWTEGGRKIVFSSEYGGRESLWRIPVSHSKAPERIPGTEDAACPCFSKGPPPRLAYHRGTGIFRTGVEGEHGTIWHAEILPSDQLGPPVRIIASSEFDWGPQVSPDGKKIVFGSARSGKQELWICDRDGSNPTQLTTAARYPGSFPGSPRWSSDSKRIAFDGASNGNLDIYVIDAGGGATRRLTADPALDARPSWSHDDRWIYFLSNRSGTDQIWKAPAEGGAAVPVTRHGGFEPIESPDGRTLYYVNVGYNVDELPELWSVPAGGGEESRVAGPVWSGYWGVADPGVYWVDFAAGAKKGPVPLKSFNFSTRRVSQVGEMGTIPRTNAPAFSVTRDGRWVLWSRFDEKVPSSVMMIENFR